MLCKYYSPVHTATTEQSNIVSPTCSPYFPPSVEKLSSSIPFHEKTALRWNTATFSLMNEIYEPCLMWGEGSIQAVAHAFPPKTGSRHAWPLPPCSDSSPLSYLPPRQPRLGNRSLFKSFMSTPQKRKACRKLRDRNEECVIVPLICDDLWHNGCNWFDNHSLFPLRREES